MSRKKVDINKLISMDGLQHIYNLAFSGISERLIAYELGISQDTLTRYKQDYADISAAIKRGREDYKEVRIAAAENELKNRITGHYITETITDTDYDSDGNITGSHKREITKWIEPSDTAVIFTLKKLCPAQYGEFRDMQSAIDAERDRAAGMWHDEVVAAIRALSESNQEN